MVYAHTSKVKSLCIKKNQKDIRLMELFMQCVSEIEKRRKREREKEK